MAHWFTEMNVARCDCGTNDSRAVCCAAIGLTISGKLLLLLLSRPSRQPVDLVALCAELRHLFVHVFHFYSNERLH